MSNESVQCGNPYHPSGAWHTSTPLPASWECVKRFKFWLNKKRWGCGCNQI